MSVTNLKSKSGGDIESTKWFLDDTTPIGREQTIEKLFPTFGSFKISVEIIDTAGNKVTLSEDIVIEKPLQLIKNGSSESLLVVKDSE